MKTAKAHDRKAKTKVERSYTKRHVGPRGQEYREKKHETKELGEIKT